MPNTNRWIVNPRPNKNAKLRLICFPYAGGSASTYIPWASFLPKNVELIAIQPPGRSSRLFEPTIKNMDNLVQELMSFFPELIERPYILFGHSLGSRIAFEVAKHISKHGMRLPLQFIASASRSPYHAYTETAVHKLPDEMFKEELKRLNGTPREILENRELMELYLPALRADFKLSETYVCEEDYNIHCPISIFAGKKDVEITKEQLLGWRICFNKLDNIHYFSGGHFFIDSERAEVLNVLNQIVSEQLPLEC